MAMLIISHYDVTLRLKQGVAENGLQMIARD